MDLPLDEINACRNVRDYLHDGISVVLIAPKYFGKRDILDWVREIWSETKSRCILNLDCQKLHTEAGVDFESLWNEVKIQLKVKYKLKLYTQDEVLKALDRFVSKLQCNLLIVVRCGGRSFVKSYYNLMWWLYQMKTSQSRIQVIGTNDSSVWKYLNKEGELRSLPHAFNKIPFSVLTIEEITNIVKKMTAEEKQVDEEQITTILVPKLKMMTGGHPGLLFEMLRDFKKRNWKIPSGYWDVNSSSIQQKSSVLNDIRVKGFQKDSKNLCSKALEYVEPRAFDPKDEDLQWLTEIGVVIPTESGAVQLCPGIIRHMIENLNKMGFEKPSEKGVIISIRKTEKLITPSDSDFVVVHLSDLHVGKNYRFKLEWGRKRQNHSDKTAQEMLEKDLYELGLLKRIDVLIITGDFIQGKNISEFNRAEDVIRSLCTLVKVKPNRLLIIPGNHDVHWNPKNFEKKEKDRSVSLEPYQNFFHCIKNKKLNSPEKIDILSKDKKRRLVIIGFDSNTAAIPEKVSYGFVSDKELSRASSKLKSLKPAVDNYDSLWMAMHHHLFQTVSEKIKNAIKGKIGVTANAPDILEWMSDNGVKVLLHGHEHQPSVTTVQRWPNDKADVTSQIAVIGAGSFSVNKSEFGPFGHNHYYIIIDRSDSISIHSRRLGDKDLSFVEHDNLVISYLKNQK